jgi:RNA polymerase sigma-70 factor (ECF subfamily)
VFIILSGVKQLIRSAQAGHLDAFDDLLVLYQDRVYSHCMHLTGNHEDAADLAQEVFIRAYQNIVSFRGEADFGTWLHRIAVNLWINERKRARNKIISLSIDEPLTTDKGDMIVRELEAEHASPAEYVERLELAEQLQRALSQLTEEFRMVVILRDVEGYSYSDIANITGSSLGTVKSRISRARNMLKKLL